MNHHKCTYQLVMLLQLVMAALVIVVVSYCCLGTYYWWILSIVDCCYSKTSEIVGVHYQGTTTLCACRQPIVSDLTSVDSLAQFRLDNYNLPIIIVSDLNVHERDWLNSPFISLAGATLRRFCELFGLFGSLISLLVRVLLYWI